MASHEHSFAPPDKNSDPTSADLVLQALRLGYLTVEAYSRLKSRINRKRRAPAPNPDRRFEFTKPNRQSQYYQALRTAGQLSAQARGLDLEAPPIPTAEKLKEILRQGLDEAAGLKIHRDLDDWAQQVELSLSLRNETAARAFGFGGSFASTYWDGYAAAADQQPKKYGSLLDPGRLQKTAERLESLREHLPPYWLEALGYALKRWSIGEKVRRFESFEPRKRGLESQMTIWRDMLFGRRPPESFLSLPARNRVQLIAYLSTAGLVIAALLTFWLILWSVPTVVERLDFADWLAEAFRPATKYVQTELPIQVDSKLDGVVKAGSALVATVSAVAVFIAGVIARVSGWILRLHARVDFFYRSRAIRKRTLVAPAASDATPGKTKKTNGVAFD
ncbi:MAG: hypothetical protein RIF32_10085 [Leptospirales bacterium]|jgi:hypothetical protein